MTLRAFALLLVLGPFAGLAAGCHECNTSDPPRCEGKVLVTCEGSGVPIGALTGPHLSRRVCEECIDSHGKAACAHAPLIPCSAAGLRCSDDGRQAQQCDLSIGYVADIEDCAAGRACLVEADRIQCVDSPFEACSKSTCSTDGRVARQCAPIGYVKSAPCDEFSACAVSDSEREAVCVYAKRLACQTGDSRCSDDARLALFCDDFTGLFKVSYVCSEDQQCRTKDSYSACE